MLNGVYLEFVIEFTRRLREAGLSVGASEQQAAAETFLVLGAADKEVLRDGLQAVLAKSQREQQTFQKEFDAFFVGFDRKLAAAAQKQREAEELERRRKQMEEDLRFNGKEVPLREEMKELYLKLPEEERDKLLKKVDRYRESAGRHPGLYDNFIQSVFLKTILEQQMLAEDAGLGNAENPEGDLLFREITAFGDADLQRAAALINRIAKQLNGELTAKRKAGGSSGPLDFRATIRKGLETGGALTRLKYRKKRAHRRRLVLLCDVSGSMMQFSEFVLRFMKCLSDVSGRMSIYLFSEELRRVEPDALGNMDRFRDYVRHSGLFGKGTDLKKALETLRAVRPSLFDGSTVFLVLTDCKTVDTGGAMEALGRIMRLAGKTVFLCPIPKEKWQYLTGCRNFSAVVDMLPCSTIGELSAACKRLFAG